MPSAAVSTGGEASRPNGVQTDLTRSRDGVNSIKDAANSDAPAAILIEGAATLNAPATILIKETANLNAPAVNLIKLIASGS
jgi:hypothetical protein